MATPQILSPDGTLTTSLLFSTTSHSRFFTGTADSTTVDLEVSIRGATYTRDSDYIAFDGEVWTVPNPDTFPNGLDLIPGENDVLIRAISSAGTVSSSASIQVSLVRTSDVGLTTSPPTNVSVCQKDTSVSLTVESPTGTDAGSFQGINYYASKYEGGGATGYIRLNLNTVSSGSTVEEVTELGSTEVESNVQLNNDGTLLVDPMYFQLTGEQVDAKAVAQTADPDFTETINIPEGTTKLRTSTSVSSVRTITTYSFDHNRLNNQNSDPATVYVGSFAGLSQAENLYYVMTAVYYDAANQIEVESSFSAEVVGRPLKVSQTVGSFPVVTRTQIVRNLITSVQRSSPQIKVEPGSVLRDTFIDPASSESVRLRYIVDFLHRASSFPALLAIDDPNRSGVSIAVSSSTYKRGLKSAFFLSSDTDVQAVIDRAFESLAAKFGKFRRAGKQSRGEVLLFTTSLPKRTIPIPLGTVLSAGSVQFVTTIAKSIPLSRLASVYDPITGRYRVTASVQASSPGSAGNVSAGQVRKIVSGATNYGLSVTNMSAMFGGTDSESNLALAERAMNALASVDSGTKRGYLQIAADVPGVVQANVVAAGDVLMQRDLDATNTHRGGKVDVWVAGEAISTVTDTFSFAFNVAKDVQFVLIGSVSDLIFQAVDATLTQAEPILSMLSDTNAGYEFRNATTGLVFDLTNVTFLSYNTIQLNTTIVQPALTLTDVILGDYRRQTGNTFVLPRQPVREIISVVGEISGQIPTTAYSLFSLADPLKNGRSILAEDYLAITPVSDGVGGWIPTGASLTVPSEAHVLTGTYPESLDHLGVNEITIVVQSADGSITYLGPHDPSGTPDYTITSGSETVATAITRTTTGTIVSGQSVLVSYEHDEAFTVSYTTNSIVEVAQEAIDAQKHLTADVIVKEAVEVPIAISASIVLSVGADQGTVDTDLRTSISTYFIGRRLGDPVRQSDIVAVMEAVSGISYVQLPLTVLSRVSGSRVVRESLQSGFTYLSAYSNTQVSVWLSETSLSAVTTVPGTNTNVFQGVFQNDTVLDLITQLPDVTLKVSSGRSFIVGPDGLDILGVSDDATLISQGYITSAEIVAQRLKLTASHVLVSTAVSDAPGNYAYTTTYIVGTDTSVKNIDPGIAEILTLGTLDFTYTEDV